MQISLIAAMAHNRVIGKLGGMPWSLPEDLRHFKRMTLGKPVIMGRKTYQSLQGPLPQRRNIILSRDPTYQVPGCLSVGSMEEALDACIGEPEIMIIGGATVYEACLPLASRMYLTLIDADFPGDTFFPAYQEHEWQLLGSEAHQSGSLKYRFVTLQRVIDPEAGPPDHGFGSSLPV